MPKHKTALLAAFAPVFKGAGFQKKASSWLRTNADTVELFNVQCSQWSECYHFNCGIFIRSLWTTGVPSGFQWDICTRIPRLESHGEELWSEFLTLPYFEAPASSGLQWVELDPKVRIARLASVVSPLALEWLNSFRRLEDVKRRLKEKNACHSATFSKGAMEHLMIFSNNA